MIGIEKTMSIPIKFLSDNLARQFDGYGYLFSSTKVHQVTPVDLVNIGVILGELFVDTKSEVYMDNDVVIVDGRCWGRRPLTKIQ